jgi:SAM-dependent methyltransferase
MISIGLSHKKHLPVWKWGPWTFAPWQIRKALDFYRKTQRLNVRKINDENYLLDFCGFKNIELPRYYAVALLNELEGEWRRFYAPVSLKGKTVLDVGAGAGETALFFLSMGAKKVVTIEPNPQSFSLLKRNTRELSIEYHNERFQLGHLEIPHDFMKMDIEGGEELLLGYEGDLGPCTIETHDFIIRDITPRLLRRFANLTAHVSTRIRGSAYVSSCIRS